jgi:hypothetical protein
MRFLVDAFMVAGDSVAGRMEKTTNAWAPADNTGEVAGAEVI